MSDKKCWCGWLAHGDLLECDPCRDKRIERERRGTALILGAVTFVVAGAVVYGLLVELLL